MAEEARADHEAADHLAPIAQQLPAEPQQIDPVVAAGHEGLGQPRVARQVARDPRAIGGRRRTPPRCRAGRRTSTAQRSGMDKRLGVGRVDDAPWYSAVAA
ncbi:MAG: hypothetical protein R3F59_15375 [Myxococcota bacterium]